MAENIENTNVKGASKSSITKAERIAAGQLDSPELIKFRLLGAIVTFVLLALFGPELLDGSGRIHTIAVVDIPPRPVLPAPPLMKPVLPKGTGFYSEEQRAADYGNAVVLSANKQEVKKTSEVRKKAKKVVPVIKTLAAKPGWTLQLATFSQAKNAYALRDKLTKSGFHSYNRLLKDSSGKTRYQVCVGPEIDKKKLMVVKQKLATKLKLKDGIIKPYRP